MGWWLAISVCPAFLFWFNQSPNKLGSLYTGFGPCIKMVKCIQIIFGTEVALLCASLPFSKAVFWYFSLVVALFGAGVFLLRLQILLSAKRKEAEAVVFYLHTCLADSFWWQLCSLAIHFLFYSLSIVTNYLAFSKRMTKDLYRWDEPCPRFLPCANPNNLLRLYWPWVIGLLI